MGNRLMRRKAVKQEDSVISIDNVQEATEKQFSDDETPENDSEDVHITDSTPTTNSVSRTKPKQKISILPAFTKTKRMKTAIAKFSPRRKDAFDYYGKYIAAVLRGLPTHRSLKLQQQFGNLVYTDQMNAIDDVDH